MIPASRRSDLDLDSGSVYMEPNPMEISQNSWEVQFVNSKNGICGIKELKSLWPIIFISVLFPQILTNQQSLGSNKNINKLITNCDAAGRGQRL